MDIFIHRNGAQYGPYSVDQARVHLASGDLSPDDLAWHEGAPDWLPLHHILAGGEAEPPRTSDTAPSWVPSRRDGSTPVSFTQPSRIPALNPATAANPPATQEIEQPSEPLKPAPRRTSREWHPSRSKNRNRAIIGAVVLLVGCAMLVFTNSHEQTDVIGWGLVLTGGARFALYVARYFFED